MQIQHLVVTGTDTEVGKTVVSAMLMQAFQACYYKPIQAGLHGATDIETVRALTGLPDERFIAEAYRLNTPASPHLAAALDAIQIDFERLKQLPSGRACPSLIIEGAGGAMVPVTGRPQQLFIDLFAAWRLPAVICARTTLGTINHTLLTIAAMQNLEIPILGIVFVGDAHESNESTICELGQVRRLGRLPFLDPLNDRTLAAAFEQRFRRSDFVRQT